MTDREHYVVGGEVPIFEHPLEFLGEFVDEMPPYDGLLVYFADELDQGHEAKVRGYVEELALDVREQDAYSRLLLSMLGQLYGSKDIRANPVHHPKLEASINYLRYRLALGIMEPAIGVALDLKNPEHTRVQIHRTLVAANMTRRFVRDTFSDTPAANTLPTGLLDGEVAGHLKHHFTGMYHRTDESIVSEYLTKRADLLHIDRQEDSFRLFDIKDFSTRVQYAKRDGKVLPTADELTEILERKRRRPTRSYSRSEPVSTNGNGSNGHSPVDAAAIQHFVIGEAFKNTDLTQSPEGSSGSLDLSEWGQWVAESDPLGRRIVRASAAVLVRRLLSDHPIFRIEADGRRTQIPKEVGSLIKDRLIAIMDTYGRRVGEIPSGEYVPIDEFFDRVEADRIARLGDLPTRRDFWDYGDE